MYPSLLTKESIYSPNGKQDNFTEELTVRRGKGSAYVIVVSVPTIVNRPGVTKPGSTCDEPVMGIDFYLSLLDITGTLGNPDHNAAMDGVSIKALIEDPDATIDRDLFWHFPHFHAGGDSPYSTIRSKDWRLVEFLESGSIELYNLKDDVGESKNLAASNPEIAQDLQKRLQQWRQDVDAQAMTENPNFNPERSTQVAKKKK